jgi:DNA-binding SARP family transcriptional activator/tetratricopeptide (TPR) repeat protein
VLDLGGSVLVEFGVLGPLQVNGGGVVLSAKQRILLAVLLLHASRVVPVEALIDALWDDAPPSSARVTLQGYVKQLRQKLGGQAGKRLVTRSPGYLMVVAAGELDLDRFTELSGQARSAADRGDWPGAATLFGEALSLWRGDPLADVPAAAVQRTEVPRLAELRMRAVESQVDAGLRLGRHRELVAELLGLVGGEPWREGLHGQLMLALYRCGRQAEALEVFRSIEQRFRAELGISPGPELQHLHHRILTADPSLTDGQVSRSGAGIPAGEAGVQAEALAACQDAGGTLVTELGTEAGPRLRDLHQQVLSADPALHRTGPPQPGQAKPEGTVPRELPPSVLGFTGRSAELAALTRLLDRPAEGTSAAIVISAIGGTAGVGKTALAVQWAHQAADRFPGGQLYVNLRGYDPDQPLPAADALAGFLRSLGVPGQEIPPGQDERAARYRSLLAGRKMLVVLDNAGSVEQVRPLLPGSPGCAVVVTSRDALAGLVARHGATRLDLDLLPLPEAIGLLRGLIGQRAEDDPAAAAAAALAGQCCRLPLALRVAAARPDVPLAGLVTELADQRRRLDLLDAGGDPRTAVRAVFSWSYRHLDPGAALGFRLAGLHPGADFDPYAVGALTGLTVEQARAVLDLLARAHLIWPTGPGRYGLHDLLRAYARELADTRDGEGEHDAALTRLFDHYLHTASMAMDALYPAESHRRPHIPTPTTPVPPVTEQAAARAWLDTERATLVAVTAHAAGHGWPSHATRLSGTVYRYLDTGGHYPQALTIHSHARAAAQQIGDQAAEATALNYLGAVHHRQGRYQQAADHLRQALTLFRQTGDRTAQARALNSLGNICYFQGRYQEAIGLPEQALAIYRETGDPFGTAMTLNNIAIGEERLGRYDLAASHLRQALAITADIGARDTECLALINLGIVSLGQTCYQEAASHLHRALALSREIGYRDSEAEALARIGDLCQRQGRPGEAASYLREGLALCRELGNPSGEADARNSLGKVLLTTGQPDQAGAEYATALSLATQTGDKYQQALAHHGLGRAGHADGDPGDARRHWQQALEMFTELGTPEAGQVRAEMATIDLNQRSRS